MAEELVPNDAPAVKCSYCGRVYQDDEKHDMGFEMKDWAICSRCFMDACNKSAV